MASRMVQIIFDLTDNFTGKSNKIATAVSNLNSKIGSFQDNLDNVVNSSRSLGGGLLALSAPLIGIGGLALKAASATRQTEIAFEALFQSKEKADDFIESLDTFSKSTTLGVVKTRDLAKSLLNVGVSSEEVVRQIKAIGDVAAGIGMERLPQVALAYQQVMAKGKLQGEELLQFVEAGVPLYDALAKHLGVAKSEIQDMAAKGKISSDDLVQAFQSLSSEGGQFADFMNKINDLDPLARFQLSIANVMAGIGDFGNAVLPTITPAIDAFGIAVDRLLEKWNSLTDTQKKFAGKAFVAVTAFAAIGGAIFLAISAVGSFVSSMAAIGTFVSGTITLLAGLAGFITFPFVLGAAAIAGLVVAGYALYRNWDLVKTKAQEVWGSIVSTFEVVKTRLSGIFAYFQQLFQEGDYLNDNLQFLPEWFQKLALKYWEFVNTISDGWDALKTRLSGIGAYFQQLFGEGDLMNDNLQFLPEILQNIITKFWEFGNIASQAWSLIVEGAKFAVAFLIGSVVTAFNIMGVDIIAVLNGIRIGAQMFWSFLGQIFTAGQNYIISGWGSMNAYIQSATVSTVGFVQNVTSAFWGFVTQLFSWAQGVITSGWDWFLSGLSFILETYVSPMQGRISAFGEWITGVFERAKGIASSAWSSMWGGISSIASSMAEKIKGVVSGMMNWIISKINSVIGAINRVAQAGADVAGISVGSIPEIPALAKGGIVTRPTLAMIGEGGESEAVIPLSKLGSVGGGGSPVINIHWSGAVDERSAEMVAKTIVKELNLQAKYSMI